MSVAVNTSETMRKHKSESRGGSGVRRFQHNGGGANIKQTRRMMDYQIPSLTKNNW